jgi:hypothetical protein
MTVGPKRQLWTSVLVAFVLGCAAAFIYFNVDPFERRAADATGFQRWSLWGLPFTVPWGALGAVAWAGAS